MNAVLRVFEYQGMDYGTWYARAVVRSEDTRMPRCGTPTRSAKCKTRRGALTDMLSSQHTVLVREHALGTGAH